MTGHDLSEKFRALESRIAAEKGEFALSHVKAPSRTSGRLTRPTRRLSGPASPAAHRWRWHRPTVAFRLDPSCARR